MQYRPPKKRFEYGELISGSFRITWRYKFLWFFGLFAGGATSFSSPSFNSSWDSSSNNGSSTGVSDFDTDVSNWIEAHVTLLIILGIAIVAIFILIWLWSIICRGAIISSVRDTRDGRHISFRTALTGGRRSFARLLYYDLFILLLMVGIFIIFAALGIMIFFLAASGSAGATILSILGVSLLSLFIIGFGYLTCCSMLFLYTLPLTILMSFAQRAVVLDEVRPMESLRRAWHLMMDNLGHSLLIVLLSAGLGLAAGIGIFLATGLASIPAIIAWIITIEQFSLTKIIVSSLLTVPPLAVLLIGTGAMNAYFNAYWTIAYRKLAGQESAVTGNPPEINPAPGFSTGSDMETGFPST